MKLFCKKNAAEEENDIPTVCAYCEHCLKLEVTDSYICKRKGVFKQVEDTESCRKFSPDMFKLSPTPRKIYRFETSRDF